MKDSSAPQAPNPEVTIPLQGAENRKTFDYQLGQMRTNTSGPTGSSTWTKTPTFDQAGYDKALSDWNAQQTTPVWVPASTDPTAPNGGKIWRGDLGVNGEWVDPAPGEAGAAGYWQPGTTSGTPKPTQDDFTNYDWTLTNTLSPEQQALYDTNVKNTGERLALSRQATGQLGDFLSGLAGGGGELGGLDQGLADTIYGQQTRYLDPQMEQQRSRLMAELADSGFVPGTPAYDQAMQNFSDTANRAYGAARDSAIVQGYNQGNTAFNQRQQIASLLSNLSGGGIYNLPNLGGGGTSSAPNLGSTDIMGALNQQYQGQLGQYGANVSSNNATMSAIAGLLSTFLMGSDARLKEDIQTEGFLPSGLRKVSFRYRGGRTRFLGVLAQEAREFFPEAVYLMPDGFYSVDYSRIR